MGEGRECCAVIVMKAVDGFIESAKEARCLGAEVGVSFVEAER